MKYISLFSGIEAASVAWVPLGWEPVAFAEIEPFPSQVLAYRFPNVPNLGDVTKVDWSKYRGKCDLIIGGSPCQSFSIAGLRKGLADPRGNLMLEYLRACEAVNPEWIIWENVPGVLSADGRRAFQTFIEAVVNLWPGGGCAWRVLDAQFFGVAQRRRRVFAVINTRDWRRAAAVLFDPESLPRDLEPNSKKREDIAANYGYCAPTYSIPGSVMILRADHLSQNGTNVTQDLCHTLDCASQTPIVCIASGQANAETTEGISPTLTALHEQPIICMADDNAHAAINEGVAPTLKVGGGKTLIAYQATVKTT